MTECVDALPRIPAVIVAARHRWRDPEVVVRWVDQRASTLATARTIPELVRRHEHTPGGRGMRLDVPFAPTVAGLPDSWIARGRLVPGRRRPLRPFRVVVAINPWSRTEVELQIAPRSRRALRRWGRRRQERFWGLAHDAADQLAHDLAPEAGCRPTVARRNGRLATTDEWADATCAHVHPMFLPAGAANGQNT